MSALSLEVATIVGRAITARRLVAGAKLGERELGETLGVSRIVARQALIRLTEDGLVTIKKNKGAFVSKPTQQQTFELFEAMAAVEQGVAVQLIDHVDGGLWDQLKAQIAREASGCEDLTIGDEPNVAADFHTLFVSLSRNRVIIEVHANLMRRALSLNSVYQWGHEGGSLLQDHGRLAEFIEKKQLRQAVDSIGKHYQHIVRAYHFEPESVAEEMPIAEALAPFMK